MSWTTEQVLEYAKRQDKTRAARLRAREPECDSSSPLDSPPAREAESVSRSEICFIVYAVRPLDWDNYFFKPLQDLLIKAGILAGDNWLQLEGRIRSRKVSTESEERTEIELTHENR